MTRFEGHQRSLILLVSIIGLGFCQVLNVQRCSDPQCQGKTRFLSRLKWPRFFYFFNTKYFQLLQESSLKPELSSNTMPIPILCSALASISQSRSWVRVKEISKISGVLRWAIFLFLIVLLFIQGHLWFVLYYYATLHSKGIFQGIFSINSFKKCIFEFDLAQL